MSQLTLFTDPAPPVAAPPPAPPLTWTHDPVDRSDMGIFTHLIRAKGDPERQPPDMLAKWRRKLMKESAAAWAERIAEHLADGIPRTFNRIGVELLDKTADNLFETPVDEALWLLVAQGRIEHTTEAPVLWQLRSVAA